jgi:non-specific protein-tyrosine kinase
VPEQIPDKNAEWLQPPVEEEGLRRYVETIRERLPLVILAVLVTTGFAIAYVLTAAKTYEAQANLLITPVGADDPVVRSLPVIVESVDPTRDVETAAQFVATTDVAERVKEELDRSESPRDLAFKVTSEPVAQSNIVAITSTGDSPEAARDLANAFAGAVIEERTVQVHEAIDTILPPLEAQLESSSDPAVRETIGAQVAQLEALRAAPDPSMRVQTEADLPTTQASPRPVLSVAAGIVAGLVLGIAGAFASQALDPRLRREAQLRRLYRLPILARIPRESGRARRSPLGPRRLSQVGSEAYRMLRSTLDASRPNGGGSRVILVGGKEHDRGQPRLVARPLRPQGDPDRG